MPVEPKREALLYYPVGAPVFARHPCPSAHYHGEHTYGGGATKMAEPFQITKVRSAAVLRLRGARDADACVSTVLTSIRLW